MELTHRDVLEILDLLEGSDVEYLEIEVGETRIVADRSGEVRSAPDGTKARIAPAPPATPVAPVPPAASATQASEHEIDPKAATYTNDPTPRSAPQYDTVSVTAPVVGVFYRSPEPGGPPFTEVGATVGEGETVGLVEVMKMFNSVTAPVRGEVVEILVHNEEFVEFGQTLMTVRPDRGA
jgi:acetyl-CoA carboxylase biotin carboxyl carrier protein